MAAKNKFMNAMKMPAIADMFSSEADRQRESGDLVTEVPLSELHPFVNHPFEVRDDTTEILNALFEIASTVTTGISGYVGSGEVNTTVDIENAIAALPGGIGNMPVALELMVVGWMLRIVNIVVNTIVAARFIELYVYNAMASLSIATLCYQELHGIAVNFLKSYLAVALQGAVLYLVIGFYPALAGSLGTGGSITEQAWAMLGQSVILLVAVFMSGKFTKAITNAMT